MACIEIKNLTVSYDEKKVLDNISLNISEGDFLCVLGKNGSGKSTFAKSLNGLVLPQTGDVVVYDMNTKDETKLLDIRKNIGMTFQNPDNQIVASIVEEDVAFGLENLGIESTEIRKRIDETLKRLSIYDLKDKLVSKLSGGQKQKVSIAGILAMKSKIIVLDEPTSMIDVCGRKELLDLVKKLNEEGITIILISHNVEEIAYAKRVIVLNDGQIRMDDTPKNILLKEEELKTYGIELPYIAHLASTLKKQGKNYKGNETLVDELF